MTIVLPGIVASDSKSAHSSPHHWSVPDSHVQLGIPGSIVPRSNVEVLVTSKLIPVVRATYGVEGMSVGRVGLQPPVAVSHRLKGEVDLLVAPLRHIRECLAS
jgi:hypothetical protein